MRRATFAGAICLAVMVSAAPAAQAKRTPLAGKWANPAPCVFTAYDVLGSGEFSCIGSSIWQGSFTGSTTFVAKGTVDLLTGDSSGTIDETFTGLADDGTNGTLHLLETYTIDGESATIHIDARIVGGTGGFAPSHGEMSFYGPYPLVAGAGEYRGSWTHPARPHGP